MLAPGAWSRGSRTTKPSEGWSAHERALVEDALAQLDATGRAEVCVAVHNTDRAVATGLAGELARRAHQRRMAGLRGEGSGEPLFPAPGSLRLRLEGSAGQGLAAFAVEGMHVDLRGEANDGVAKSMAGGRLIVRPPTSARYLAEDNVILGNGALYGATGGTLYVHGRAGDRFAVRNSGATAVVEGTGLHACEYMTAGTVVILGPLSANAGAGMTGGRLYVPPEHRGHLDETHVVAVPIADDERDELLALLRDYLAATGSRTARALVAQPSALGQRLVRVWPRATQPVDEQRALG
jgi:glutamate synthase domain-containing protein 3